MAIDLFSETRAVVRLVGRAVMAAIGLGRTDASGGRGRPKLSRAERKAAGTSFTSAQRREDAAGCAFISLLLALALVAFVSQARGGSSGSRAISQLSTSPPATALASALFDGPPYLIECLSEGHSTPLNKMVEAGLLPAGVRAAQVDCSAPLPSGRTILRRFFGIDSLPAGSPPLLLAAGGQVLTFPSFCMHS